MEATKTETPKRKRGRPKGTGKISPEITETLCKNIKAGLTITSAVRRAGITFETYSTWRDKGKAEKKGVYFEFSEAVDDAFAFARGALEALVQRVAHEREVVKKRQVIHPKTGEVIELVEKTMEYDGAMARFLLERRYPEDWGKKDVLDITSGGEAIKSTILGNVTMGSTGKVEN